SYARIIPGNLRELWPLAELKQFGGEWWRPLSETTRAPIIPSVLGCSGPKDYAEFLHRAPPSSGIIRHLPSASDEPSYASRAAERRPAPFDGRPSLGLGCVNNEFASTAAGAPAPFPG